MKIILFKTILLFLLLSLIGCNQNKEKISLKSLRQIMKLNMPKVLK
jgi:hypothetical protein